jgi:hypothetical protein
MGTMHVQIHRYGKNEQGGIKGVNGGAAIAIQTGF